MRAMVLEQISSLADNATPLKPCELPEPVAKEGQILIRVSACGVCHTELDEIEGRLSPPQLPIILGHQVVGRVAAIGSHDSQGVLKRSGLQSGDRIGVAWINSACGRCDFCRSGLENLCPDFKATGLDAHGGYAQYLTVRADFAYRLPAALSDVEAAPAWTPVVEALKNLDAGGRLVINAIRKEATDQRALLDLDYPDQLWHEKEIKSVANVTRRDVQAFLQLAAEIPLRPEVECYALDEANRALLELKRGHIRGAKVLVID